MTLVTADVYASCSIIRARIRHSVGSIEMMRDVSGPEKKSLRTCGSLYFSIKPA